MTAARMFRKGSATLRSQFYDVSRTPHLRFWMGLLRIPRIVLTAQGKLTINHSLHWGTITIFRVITGGPGNSVH
jgi:hypothetical protein